MSTHFRHRLARFAPLLAVVLIAGCSDLTGDLGGDFVSGLTIEDRDTGATLVTVTSSSSVSGSLNIARNEQRSLAIVLRDANGSVVLPGISENVRITIVNPGVASWTDTSGGAGTLRGNTTGTTTMKVDIIQTGTVEYTSPSITINVS